MDEPSPQQILQARILARDFFNRDAITVARGLLGKLLVRRQGRKLLAGRVVETEAYLGEDDPAAHAFSGRTARNGVLFGPPGHAYVYFIYGNHFCLNVSCRAEGHGVLFRAMEPVCGIEAMAEARGLELSPSSPTARLRLLSSGPGRMSEAMAITRERDNDKDFTSRQSDLWLADDRFRPSAIIATPRIGITKAAERPLRFVVAHNAYVSGRKIE